MQLSPDQGRQVYTWLKDNNLLSECPCCGKRPDWILNGPQPKDVPLVYVACSNCFFVLQFDSNRLFARVP